LPFQSKKPSLELSSESRDLLTKLSNSRTESAHKIERARMLIAYADGSTISSIAAQLGTNRMKVERSVNKALQIGAEEALNDLPGRGRHQVIPDEARSWILSLACQKPKDLGYSYELWTTQLLSDHIQKNAVSAGHPSLGKLSKGTVSKILSKSAVRPYNIKYYLEKRDPEFEANMAQVLCVYREVALLRNADNTDNCMVAIMSYDEKPGIQAIENTAPDLPPVPGKYACLGRNYEYVRHGTVSLLAGIDLLTGIVHGIIEDRHRSCEFIKFLKVLDESYPPNFKLKIILDNHSTHISKETRAYLATVPNRFEFIFTPKHGSWLNLVESFFSKMVKSMLREIWVKSIDELKSRIEKYLDESNDSPVVYKWTYGINSSDNTQDLF
jgi:transposase